MKTTHTSWTVIEHRVALTSVWDVVDGDLRLVCSCTDEPTARLIAAAPLVWNLLKLVMDDDDTRTQYADEWQAIVKRVEG